MDWTLIFNYGVPTVILAVLIVGCQRAGKFIASEIREWRAWYTKEYWPAHHQEIKTQTETLVEVKTLLDQMIESFRTLREDFVLLLKEFAMESKKAAAIVPPKDN